PVSRPFAAALLLSPLAAGSVPLRLAFSIEAGEADPAWPVHLPRELAANRSVSHPPIARLVPQAGAMCLLDEIVSFDERAIVCRASSHRSPGNPLRCDGRLSAFAGIEYGAQAMAVHGALQARQPEVQ